MLPAGRACVIYSGMKIATFNANSLRARAGIVRDWLQQHSPDVLCIQETKVQDHEFPLAEFEDSGYEIVFRGEKSYNGVAVSAGMDLRLSRSGLTVSRQTSRGWQMCG